MNRVARALRALLSLLWAIVRATVNAIYKAVTRAALYLATVYLVVHFSVNSGAFRGWLMDYLGTVMPGSYRSEALQWGPLPWNVTLLDVEIQDPTGTPVVRVARTTAAVDLLAMWGWAVRKAVLSNVPFELRFTRAYTDGAEVLVDVHEDGWVGIAAAFSDMTRKVTEKGPGSRIEINGVVIDNGRVRVRIRGAGIRVDGRELRVLGRVVIADGRTLVTSPIIESGAGLVEIDGAGPDGTTLRLPWTNFEATAAVWNHGLLKVGQADLIEVFEGSYTPLQVSGRLDTRGKRTTVDATAVLDIAAGDPLVASYAGDSLVVGGPIDVRASGPFSWPELEATLDATTLEVDGIELGPRTVSIAMRRDPYRHVLQVSPMSFDLADGLVHLDRLDVQPAHGGDILQRFDVALRMEGVVPTTLWDLGLLAGPIPLQPAAGGDGTPPGGSLAAGRLDGQVRAVVKRRLRDGGDLWTIEGALDLGVDWAGNAALPLSPSLWLGGHAVAEVDRNGLVVTSSSLTLQSGSDRLELEGLVDLTNETLDLGLTTDLSLRPLLSTWGVPDISGDFALRGGHVTGTWLSPDLFGYVDLKAARVYGIRVDALSSRVRLDGGRLELAGLDASTGMGRLTTNAKLHLWGSTVANISETMPLVLTNAAVTGFKLGRLGIPRLSGTAQLSSRRLTARLRGPDLALEGAATVSATGLRVYGEAFSRATATLHTERRRWVLDELIAQANNGGTLKAGGHYDHVRKRIKLAARVSGVKLPDVAVLKNKGIPLEGTAGLTLSAQGAWNNPGFNGSLKVDGLAYAGIKLGSGSLRFDRAPGQQKVVLRESKLFGTKLTRGALRVTPRGIPTGIALEGSVRKVDVPSVIPDLAKQFSKLQVTNARYDLDVDFVGGEPLKLGVKIPDGGVIVGFTDDEPLLSNHGPLLARLVGRTVHIDRLAADWNGQRLAACGRVTLDGKVNVDVAGRVDLASLELAKDTLADLQGRIVTHAIGKTSVVEAFEGSCLRKVMDTVMLIRLGNPTGILHLEGPLTSPAVDGAVRLQSIRTTPRGFGQEVTIEDGVITLRSGGSQRKGEIELQIPREAPVRGTLEDGSFRLTAKAKLPRRAKRSTFEDWLPYNGVVKVRGEDLFYSAPREYRVTVDPNVTFRFWDLFTRGKKPRLELSGKIAIPEGAYFRSFNTFARAFGNVLGRSVDAYSTSLTETFPELKDMQLDLAVTGANFVLQSEFGLGSLNLDTGFDLNVRGTFLVPEIHGQLQVTDGTLTYNVVRREFEVTRGWLTFDGEPEKPTLDIEAQTFFELPVQSGRSAFGRQSSDVETYTVSLRVKGRIPEYQIELDSKPALSNIDIQYLILTGARKTDFDRQTGAAASSTIGLLGANLTQLVKSLIEAPFVDRVALTPTSGGGTEIEARLRFGRNLQFGVTGRQDSGETTYGAVFRFKFSDRLSLEGRLRRAEQDTQQRRRRYEAELKYTIPID